MSFVGGGRRIRERFRHGPPEVTSFTACPWPGHRMPVARPTLGTVPLMGDITPDMSYA
ncbi:hypothetical protein JCM4814A_47300 [Streptomyces phaeofaciens JCM 4814]